MVIALPWIAATLTYTMPQAQGILQGMIQRQRKNEKTKHKIKDKIQIKRKRYKLLGQLAPSQQKAASH